MNTISLQLPESVHEKIRSIAAREGITVDQFITTALTEKLSALLTQEYLGERAARGDRKQFERVLRKVPRVPPDESDAIR